DAYMKGSKYEEDLKALIEKGVIVSQCNNTLKERKINRDQLYNFIAIVPSGNGELIIRQAEGWSVIKP
ncbi:DsrE family protein, partial [Flavihumibacter sediminis]|nr:DsrE family protein [Flavihumibacter sediminis]